MDKQAMNDYKIECRPEYQHIKYAIYRKEPIWFGMSYQWVEMASFDTIDKAEAALSETKNFPKYYRY